MTIIKIDGISDRHPIEFNSCLNKCWIDGYIELPDQFVSVVNQYDGFVFLTIENGVLIDVEANIEAWEAWHETLPPEQEPEPTDTEVLNVLLGVTENE